MSFEISGKLVQKAPTQQVSEKFKKREFVLELIDEVSGNSYTNYAKFQLVQNKCDLLDSFEEGEDLRVNFNIKGNRWERDGKINYITNLDAWRVERTSQANNAGAPQQGYNNNPTQQGNNNFGQAPNPSFNTQNDQVDDLPF